jgi:hypothetical protein
MNIMKDTHEANDGMQLGVDHRWLRSVHPKLELDRIQTSHLDIHRTLTLSQENVLVLYLELYGAFSWVLLINGL